MDDEVPTLNPTFGWTGKPAITTPTPLIRSSEEEDEGEYKITYSSKNIELISEFNDLLGGSKNERKEHCKS